MNRERLAALEETLVWLRDATQEQFLAEGRGHIFDFQFFRFTNRCGTRMCLAGWYVARHPGCGLQFDADDCICLTGGGRVGGSLAEFGALEIYFDIPEWLAGVLFRPPNEPDDDDDPDFNTYDYQKRQFWAGRAIEQLRMLATWSDEEVMDPDAGEQLTARLYAVQLDQIPYERNRNNAS